MTVFGSPTEGVGNDAGWAFTVGDTTISRNDHYADVTATLPDGLGGGEYELAIERLGDEAHAAIAAAAETGARSPGRLYLYWRDTLPLLAALGGAGELLTGLVAPELAGTLVAELKLTRVSRRLGNRAYETLIQAREAAFVALSQPMTVPLEASDLTRAAELIGERARVSVHTYNIGMAAAGADGSIALPARISYADALGLLARRAELVTGQHGRGMVLLRDGVVHFGPRPVPLDGGKPKPLEHGADLLEVEALAARDTDRWSKDASAAAQFRLVLKGRPDIKPGDVVSCALPSESLPFPAGAGFLPRVADFAALLDEPVPSLLYVDSVRHRLGRSAGFVTTATAVVLPDLAQAWDRREPAPAEVEAGASAQANAALDAATAVRRAFSSALGRRETVDIGEVRATQPASEKDADAQTLTLWRGLKPPDGRPNSSRRLAVERERPAALTGVGYLTPFAWGPCGLVLPKYPGTRVALAHRNADPADPLELGCLWEAGGAPDARAGDWWLILPVGVPEGERADVSDESAAPRHTGPASNDLIDADGNRVIEVGELTIRVGRDSLKDAGERPARAKAADSVTIEHADGDARIVIASNGAITVSAKGTLALQSREGDITLDAKNVTVKLAGDGVMDVS